LCGVCDSDYGGCVRHNLRPPAVSGRLPYAKMLAQVAHADLGELAGEGGGGWTLGRSGTFVRG
jgi:hypothetical protein